MRGRVALEVNPTRVGETQLNLTVRDKVGQNWDVPDVTASFTLPDRELGPLRVTLERLRDLVAAAVSQSQNS